MAESKGKPVRTTRARAASAVSPLDVKKVKAGRERAASTEAALPMTDDAAQEPSPVDPSDCLGAPLAHRGSPSPAHRTHHTAALSPRSSQMHEHAFLSEYAPASLRHKTGTHEVVPLSVTQFCEQFFDDNAPHSLPRHHEAIGDQHVQATPWVATEESFFGWSQCYTREVHFSKAVTNPLAGVKRTRAIKSQRLKKYGPAGAMMLTTTRLLDIPYCTAFCVEESVVVRAFGDEHSVVDFSFEVRFLTNTILKSAIDGQTSAEMRRWTTTYMMTVKSLCAPAAAMYASRRPSFDNTYAAGTPKHATVGGAMTPLGSWGLLNRSPRGTPSGSPVRLLMVPPRTPPHVAPGFCPSPAPSIAGRRGSATHVASPAAAPTAESAPQSGTQQPTRKAARRASTGCAAEEKSPPPNPASSGRKSRQESRRAGQKTTPARDGSDGDPLGHSAPRMDDVAAPPTPPTEPPPQAPTPPAHSPPRPARATSPIEARAGPRAQAPAPKSKRKSPVSRAREAPPSHAHEAEEKEKDATPLARPDTGLAPPEVPSEGASGEVQAAVDDVDADAPAVREEEDVHALGLTPGQLQVPLARLEMPSLALQALTSRHPNPPGAGPTAGNSRRVGVAGAVRPGAPRRRVGHAHAH